MSDTPMLKFVTSDYVPVSEGELRWIFIDAPGKPAMDPTKPNRKQASLYVKTDSPACDALKDAIKAFWDDHKGKGWRAKSLGHREEMVLKEGGDADNADDYEKTGYTAFSFWTGANWPDGNDRVVDIYNIHGNKVSLGGKKIGNGSLGAISGTMAIYNNGTGANASRGVSLYLNAIQVAKFVEFAADAGFGAQEEIEGGFEGVDTPFEGTAEAEQTSDEAKPRL